MVSFTKDKWVYFLLLVIVISRLVLSLLECPKLITLSCFYCIYNTTILNCRRWRPGQMGSEPGVGTWTVSRNSHENWNNSGRRSQFRRNGEQVLLQHESHQIMAGLSLPEYNFTYILWALCTRKNPKAQRDRDTDDLTIF